jgi:hypothetical protein
MRPKRRLADKSSVGKSEYQRNCQLDSERLTAKIAVVSVPPPRLADFRFPRYGGDVEFVRLAVTPDQAKQYQLQSAPPKATDRRRFDGQETNQVEALNPRDLSQITRVAIETRLDRALYQSVLAEERRARQDVRSQLGLAP